MFELTTDQLFVLALGAIACGIYLLVKGGHWVVNAAIFVARRTGLSPMLIGATVVTFGTTLPELFASVNANLSGYPGISLGSVLGANVANILLVLGAVAIFTGITAHPRDLVKSLAMMLLATGFVVYGTLAGGFSSLLGVLMFAILVAFVIYQYRVAELEVETDLIDDHSTCDMKTATWRLLVGLAALALGSELLVQGAVQTGAALGVAEAVIGMTIVAFGTTLPELSICIAAARKRSFGLIFGNVIGSTTFNIMSILALTAIIKPVPVVPALTGFPIWATAIVALAFAIWMLVVGHFNRIAGIVMLTAYLAYIAMQYITAVPVVQP